MLHYNHTPQDLEDDKSTFAEFQPKFEVILKKYNLKLKPFDTKERVLGHGITSMYTAHSKWKEYKNDKKETLRLHSVYSFITSDIWGIVNETEPEKLKNRHFTIEFYLNGEKRAYRGRRWDSDSRICRFYDSSTSQDGILNNFEEYLNSVLLPYLTKYNLIFS